MLATLLGTGGVFTSWRAVPMLALIRMVSLAVSVMLPPSAVSSTPPAMPWAMSLAATITPTRLLCVPPLTTSRSAASMRLLMVSSPPALRLRSAPAPVASTVPSTVTLPVLLTRTWLPALAVPISLPAPTSRPSPLLCWPVTKVRSPLACICAVAVTSSPVATSTRCPPR